MAGTQFGIPPKQIDSLTYAGADLALVPVVEAARIPTIYDKNYPIDCFWRNNVTRELWWLSGFDSIGALWIPFTSGSAGPVTKFPVDAFTGPGTNPVLPSGFGQVTITGAQVAAGVVGANIIRTDSLAANTFTIEIQRTAAVASTASVNNGVAHFNSSDFIVDGNGFVSLIGATPFTWLVVTETATPVSLVNNVGYICASDGAPSALSFALPATSALGDIIEVALNGATSWTITQAAGQQIRWSGSTTTLGVAGSLATTGTGDTLRMVCQTANTIWVGLSGNGNLTVA